MTPLGYPDARTDRVPAGTRDPRTGDVLPIFIGGAARQNLAANFSMIQLWNPVTNTRTLRLRRIVAAVSVNSAVIVLRSQVALSTFVRNGASGAPAGGASSAELRTEQAVAQVGTIVSESIGVSNPGGEVFVGGDFMIAPGSGVVVTHDAVNAAVSALFEWQEVMRLYGLPESTLAP